MSITYFRPRKPGPEALIENDVVNEVQNLFPSGDRSLWTAGSLPIGGGMPDIVVVTCEPQVFAVTQVEMPNEHLLAYLRVVGRARIETIAKRMERSQEIIVRCLDGLVEVEIIKNDSGVFSLSPIWRDILPDIVTIEVKVKNWRKAVTQASRNRIFAHSSYVALPISLADRVKSESIFSQLGIGLLSVDDHHEVRILRRARRCQPRVWSYYYKLAFIMVSHLQEDQDAICCATG